MKHYEVQYAEKFLIDRESVDVVWVSKRFLTFKRAVKYVRDHPNEAHRINHIAMVSKQEQRTPLYVLAAEGYWMPVGQPYRGLDLSTGRHFRAKI
jgi:hypothetical protein